MFRQFFLSGLDAARGSVADGRLTPLIAQHWSEPTRFGDWRDLGFYFPETGTLGFSDALFLFGILLMPLNALGIDYQLGYQFTLILVTAVGYAAAVLFFRVGPRVPWLVAIPGAFTLTFANGIYRTSEHTEQLVVTCTPLLLLLALFAWRAPTKLQRTLWSIALGIGLGLLLNTDIYVFGFLMVGATVWAALLVALAAARKASLRGATLAYLTRAAQNASATAVATLPFIAMAALIYGPVARLGGDQRSRDVLNLFALWPRDLVNMGDGNLIWGWVQPYIYDDTLPLRFEANEWALSPTPLLVLLAIVLLLLALPRLRRFTFWEGAGVASVTVGLAMCFAPVRLGPFLAWEWLYDIPGFYVFRAFGRIGLIAGQFLIIGCVVLLGKWVSRRQPRVAPLWVAAGILTVIAVEQVNIGNLASYSIAKQEIWKSLPAPPATCANFVAITPLGDERDRWAAALDAMVVAQSIGLPTSNGYSGLDPRGWELWNPGTAAYHAAVFSWLQRHGLANSTCGFRLDSGQWLEPPQLMEWLQAK